MLWIDQTAPLEAHLPEVQPSTGLKPIARVTASNKAAAGRARASAIPTDGISQGQRWTKRRDENIDARQCCVCDGAVALPCMRSGGFFLLRVTLLRRVRGD